jgi:predicted transposase/invertase (TIGR01784 family)
MGSDGHKRVPQGLIADFFGIEAGLDEIRIENPYSIRPSDLRAGGEELARLRQTMRDVTLALRGADVVVELQLRLSERFAARSLYYLFDRFVSNYDQAGAAAGGSSDWRYSSLRAVFGLNILGRPFGGGEAGLRMYRLWDPVLGEAMEPELVRVGYFDLTKAGGLTPRQAAWREFFLTGRAPLGAPAYLEEASRMIEYASLGREEREMVDVLEKALATEAAQMAYARREAREQGLEQGREHGLEQGLEHGLERGRAEAVEEVARRLLAMGLDPARVAEATTLDAPQPGAPGAGV